MSRFEGANANLGALPALRGIIMIIIITIIIIIIIINIFIIIIIIITIITIIISSNHFIITIIILTRALSVREPNAAPAGAHRSDARSPIT